MPKMGITVMTQKHSFYEKLEQLINQFPKYPMNVLLGNFIAKLGKGDILNQQLAMRFHMKIAIIMALVNFAKSKLC
jgi:hypothetical protein